MSKPGMTDGRSIETMNKVRLAAVGDIMLGRDVAKAISEKGPEYPFVKIKGALEDADIRFGVLSAPFADIAASQAKKHEGCPAIRSEPEAVKGLTYAGFNVMHIGNNHTLDFGIDGMRSTIRLLEDNNIAHCGAGFTIKEAREPAIVDKNGAKFAFLGYCDSYPASNDKPGCVPVKLAYIREDIASARKAADYVIVSIHHGIEYSFYPYPEYINLARAVVDAGADAVFGHHPHVLQGYEIYRKSPIAYSLGNFVFDRDDKERDPGTEPKSRLSLEADGVIARPGSEAFYRSVILNTEFKDGTFRGPTFMPIIINDEFQPEPATGATKKAILDFMDEKSARLKERSLPFYAELASLYSQESVRYWLKTDPASIMAGLRKIRPRHVRKLVDYARCAVMSRLREKA